MGEDATRTTRRGVSTTKNEVAGIRTVPPAEAEGELAALYRTSARRREPAHIVQVHTLHSEAPAAHLWLYRTLAFRSYRRYGSAVLQVIEMPEELERSIVVSACGTVSRWSRNS